PSDCQSDSSERHPLASNEPVATTLLPPLRHRFRPAIESICGPPRTGAHWLPRTVHEFAAAGPVSFLGPTQLAHQPCPRERPAPFDRCDRDLQRFSGLYVGETDEVPEFDDLSQIRKNLLEPRQRLVKRREHGILFIRFDERLEERHAIHAAPAFLRSARTRTIHQDLSH